jgi:cellobiose PTS system EIIB component
MKNITLVCALGMSTSLLAAKMQKAAEAHGMEVVVRAIPETELADYENDTDIILLGPQVGYMLKKLKESYEPKGIKVVTINSRDYGLMDGEKVVKDTLALFGQA